MRKDNPALVYGKYTLLDKQNPDVYAYTRELDGKKLLILLNFKSKVSVAHTGLDLKQAALLSCNYAQPATSEALRPYEARVYRLND